MLAAAEFTSEPGDWRSRYRQKRSDSRTCRSVCVWERERE